MKNPNPKKVDNGSGFSENKQVRQDINEID